MPTLHEFREQLETMPPSSQLSFFIELSSGERVPVSLKEITASTNPTETVDVALEFNRE